MVRFLVLPLDLCWELGKWFQLRLNFLFLKIYEHKIYFGFLYRGAEGIQ